MGWIQHADLIGFTVAHAFIGIQRLGSFRGLYLGSLTIGWHDERGHWQLGIRWD